jgi:hypothetical protein
LLKRRKEINNKEKKKISEESCFQRKQCARITTSVFAFLANESTAHGAVIARPTRGREKFAKSSLRLWPTGSAALFFSGQSDQKQPKSEAQLRPSIRYCKQLQTFPKAVIKTSHRALDRFLKNASGFKKVEKERL